MARPPIINIDDLLRLIDEFFFDRRCGRKTTYAEIARYVAAKGYPNFTADRLKQNPKAKAYVDSLKEKEDEILTTLVSYKTLDVKELLNDNPSKELLTKKLSAVSSYYKTVAESAVVAFKQTNELEKQIESLNESLAEKTKKVEILQKRIDAFIQENNELNKEKQALKDIINKYVYPEIANKLLGEAGIVSLPSEHIIDEPEVVRADSVISFSDFMLRRFEENES